MPRIERIDVGGYIYHVLNRANTRAQIFDNKDDYAMFDGILEEAVENYEMRILAYCLMPNHWHLILHPKKDGDLQKFMGWITNTHTRRWHVVHQTIGSGHLYQGRYKSFLCQNDQYFLTLARYVERNAKKANLTRKAEQWRWSSVWRREHGTLKQKKLLSEWPISKPKDYIHFLNVPQTVGEEDAIERSITKSIPYGDDRWVSKMVKKFGLEQTLHPPGRRKNGG
jgi:putative transposase